MSLISFYFIRGNSFQFESPGDVVIDAPGSEMWSCTSHAMCGQRNRRTLFSFNFGETTSESPTVRFGQKVFFIARVKIFFINLKPLQWQDEYPWYVIVPLRRNGSQDSKFHFCSHAVVQLSEIRCFECFTDRKGEYHSSKHPVAVSSSCFKNKDSKCSFAFRICSSSNHRRNFLPVTEFVVIYEK